VLGIAIMVTPVVSTAADYDFQSNSLMGVEVGGSSIDYTYNNANSPQDVTVSSLGLKLGAETKDFRAFIDGKYFYDSSSTYDYIVTYGGALQYKLNPSKLFNIFLGVNAGIANIRFIPADGSPYRSMSSPYFGGDLGVNIHLGNTMDLELGGRVMSIQDTNTINNVEYRIGNIVNAYASLIFKWQMD
ncbi:MAG: hypothetical protein Q9M34_07375, partial [Sulfurimonas sp.]|nr:hypothetical protein [Sulfurimonas sp.]